MRFLQLSLLLSNMCVYSVHACVCVVCVYVRVCSVMLGYYLLMII